jgi:hypothetical protein
LGSVCTEVIEVTRLAGVKWPHPDLLIVFTAFFFVKVKRYTLTKKKAVKLAGDRGKANCGLCPLVLGFVGALVSRQTAAVVGELLWIGVAWGSAEECRPAIAGAPECRREVVMRSAHQAATGSRM